MRWRHWLWRRTDPESQLERELRFHLDRHAADLVARGVDSAEAQRQARLAIGGPEQVKERCRDVRRPRWIDDLNRDVRYAVRSIRRMPGFSAVILIVLALGIGATTVMFTVINSVLLRPLPYPDPGSLLSIHGFIEPSREFWGFSNPDFTDLRSQSRSLKIAAWTFSGGTISELGDSEYVDGRQVSADLFSLLGIAPVYGRAFRPDEDRPGAPPVAVISHGLWQRRYGASTSAIGRTLVFDGTPYTIVGVAPARLQLSGDADVFTPLGQRTEPRMRNRNARFLHVVARLQPGAAIGEARAELTLVANDLQKRYPESNAGVGLRAGPLQDELVGDVQSTLWVLLAAVGAVLLTGCVNIASLLLARAVARERELATRVALGASRSRVSRQCLTESAVLGLAGGTCGVVVATIGLRPFLAIWPGSLPRADEIGIDWRVLAVALGLSVVSGFLFGLAPALRVPMGNLDQTLRAGGRTTASSAHRLHTAFVVSEIALAVVLLGSAAMLARTLLSLSSLDPGLDVQNVLTARLALSPAATIDPARIPAAWADVLERARHLPGVESAALSDIVPMRPGENSLPYSTNAVVSRSQDLPIALASSVTPDYLKVMRIALRKGRFFDEHDRGDVVVVDDHLERHAFGNQDAVGKRLWIAALGSEPVRIVGVVAHVRHWGLAGDDRATIRDQMYYPLAQVPVPLLRFFSSIMSIAVRTTGPPLNVLEPLRNHLRGTAGDHVLHDVRTMEQLVSASLARQRFLALLFGIFAAVALLQACVGIYGVLAYLTSQRAPEIGVRMALGATTRDVVQLVLRQSARMIAVGGCIGICGAWAAGRVLVRVVEGGRPAGAAALAVTTCVLVFAALLASFVPAFRASRLDATQALREG